MKVTPATNTINPQTAGALFRLSETMNDLVMETTAWFIVMLRHLFKIITLRDRLFALSYNKMESYHTAIEIIRLFIYIFRNATIEGDWKVTLTHMIMCLEAILEIQEELLQKESLDFLCLARFSQDCIENEFSNIRIQRPKPSALECKNRLKQLAISRKAVSINSSSYNFNGSPTLIDLMSRIKKPKETDTLSSIVFLQLNVTEPLTDEEEEILYKMCGYVVFKLKQRIKCTDCYLKLLHSGPVLHPRGGFVKACEFLEGALVSVSGEVFQLLKAIELILKGIKNQLKDVGQALKAKLEHYLKKELSNFTISTCHNRNDFLISRYCSIRLRQISLELSSISANKNNTSAFGSKSMGSRLLADNFNPVK
ncbi:Transposable element p transposase [Temnothorax longispinosus]|uniref:Transposable element p transposase n=1 Tax=Temnothorax longispinosus TaxID=300112 RepID=A0A4S2KRK5_9HYME|nr:Transposable element p transposase [Temnothorax longispinosus]